MIAFALALALAAQAPVLLTQTSTTAHRPGYEAFSKRDLWEAAERWRSKAETRARERDVCLESKPQADALHIAVATLPEVEPPPEDEADPLVIILGIALVLAAFGSGVAIGLSL
jgi:hypothetical protein